ncbi:metal ABC transporter ATP-binding protein [Nitrosopumilus sp. b1]|uniref:metal ABC transporter ATP-binding protein n=1 Tax=Nitrosopumilus sp. b1 TaxID=2109907 RepID=UPI00210595DB|nr:metal ABC transporter ATP-binding protein [Nitrosopumilus sp. b1]
MQQKSEQTNMKDGKMYPIEIKNLSVTYRTEPALWNIDLNFPEGKMIAIVGPNGAGKSTLIKAVMGLVPITAGKVSIYGKSYSKQRSKVAYVPQRGSVDWDFPTDALDVVEMGLYGKLGWLRRPNSNTKKKARECLEKVGLGDYADRQIGQLSGGQQQRVFVARSLAQDPEIYLMDEPLNGVDAVTEDTILSILENLRKEGKTIVMVHHDLQTVDKYFDWVVLLNRNLIASGPIKEVFTKENLDTAYQEKYRVSFR